jgi:hypothetical protein
MTSLALSIVGRVQRPEVRRPGLGERLLAASFRGLCRCIEQAADLYGISDSPDELLALHVQGQSATAWRTLER